MKKRVYDYFYRLANGRINRSTFATGLLIYSFFAYQVANPAPSDDKKPVAQLPDLVAIPLVVGIVAIFLIFFLSLIARRLHDTDSNAVAVNFSGAYIGAPFVFDIRAIFKKGDPGENSYGKPPKPGIDWKGLFGF